MKTLFIASIFCSSILLAQSFTNGDLNGTIAVSAIPTGWSQVPFGDPNSLATGTPQATSDVTGTTGPVSGSICGNPFSGTTFVSGLLHSNSSVWHEGLMQNITGLTIGQTYRISFRQTVVKQSNATDNTGLWRVYQDATLVGASAPTTSTLPYGSSSGLPWDLRSVYFTATATSHWIKFLPWDDDASYVSPNSVRMGIDSINLFASTPLAEPLTMSLNLIGNAVQINWNDPAHTSVKYYEIETAPDALHFSTKGTLETNGQEEYTFADATPFRNSSYRIVSVDMDGNRTYSAIAQIRCLAPLQAQVIQRMLTITGGNGLDRKISLLSIQGEEIFTGAVEDRFDLSGYPSGFYFLQLTEGSGQDQEIFELKFMIPE